MMGVATQHQSRPDQWKKFVWHFFGHYFPVFSISGFLFLRRWSIDSGAACFCLTVQGKMLWRDTCIKICYLKMLSMSTLFNLFSKKNWFSDCLKIWNFFWIPTSQILEPKHVFLPLVKHCNYTPDFSHYMILQTKFCSLRDYNNRLMITLYYIKSYLLIKVST